MERAEAAGEGMEAYVRRGEPPGDEELREFLENLALDSLIEEAGFAGASLVRSLSLFDVPVPERVAAVVAGQVGGDVARLRGLGLLEAQPDHYDPAVTAVAVNPLVLGLLEPLTHSERAALAAIAVEPLLTAWGGPTPSRQPRHAELDLELSRLGRLAVDPGAVAASASAAVRALEAGHAGTAAEHGRAALDLLDRHARPVPLTLLRVTADATLTSGDGTAREAFLDRAFARPRRTRPGRAMPVSRWNVRG